jgi:hypothetical protein
LPVNGGKENNKWQTGNEDKSKLKAHLMMNPGLNSKGDQKIMDFDFS